MSIDLLTVSPNLTIREALARLDKTGKGILLLADESGAFLRTVTDGDLRRLLLDGFDLAHTLAKLPVRNSHTLGPAYTRREALALMNAHGINSVPVLSDAGVVIDIVRRQEIDTQILLSTPHMGEAEREFVEQAFLTNWIAPLGPNVDAFERELCAYVGSAHGAALSSGTAAIHLGLRLLDVGPGDRVFCSTMTFAASANPIMYQNAEPVFIDSEPQSWNMCPRALERAFEVARSEGWLPKAVIIVSLYGQSADMDPLIEICAHHGVPILEDAAESLGARYKGRASGTLGDIGIFSFNGNKIITTSGGGMLVSDNADLVERARFLSTQARDPAPHYQHSEIGYNYRMSNILAGVGRGQVKVLDDRVRSRRRIFERYREGLAGIAAIDWMPEPEWSFSNRWLSVASVDPSGRTSAADVIARLSAELIEARPVWKPMHLQPVFAGARYFQAHNSSVSDDLFANGLCLPSGSNMQDHEQDRVIAVLREVLA